MLVYWEKVINFKHYVLSQQRNEQILVECEVFCLFCVLYDFELNILKHEAQS